MRMLDTVVENIKAEYTKQIQTFMHARQRVYYIESGEYTQQSAGMRVPFYLCYILCTLGFETYINAREQAPSLYTPLLTADIMEKHKSDGREIIAIYVNTPGRFYFSEDLAVHWVMNKFGLVKENLCSEDELIFYWDECYSRKSVQDIELLRFPLINEDVFHPPKDNSINRSGFAYYARKYLEDNRKTLPEKMKENGISLCHDIERSHTEIADILRSVTTFYVYEETALSVEAALCGCVVVFIQSDYIVNASANSDPGSTYDYCITEDKFDENAIYPYIGITLNNYKTRFCNSAAGCIANFISITQKSPAAAKIKAIQRVCNSDADGRIFLYGAGNIGHIYLNYLKAININIEGFIVSDEKMCYYGNALFGVPINSLSWYKGQCDSSCRLVLTLELRNHSETTRMLDETGISYVLYKDAYNFRKDYNYVMTAKVKRFLKAYQKYYIFGIGSYAGIIFNTIRATGVNIAGFLIPDTDAGDAPSEQHGLPVHLYSFFIEHVYSRDCGVVFVMQYSNSYEIIDDLIHRSIDYITELT